MRAMPRVDAALLVEADRSARARAGHAPRRTAWDPKGPAAVYRARAGLDASGNVIAYEFFGKGFSRYDVSSSRHDPNDTLAGS